MDKRSFLRWCQVMRFCMRFDAGKTSSWAMVKGRFGDAELLWCFVYRFVLVDGQFIKYILNHGLILSGFVACRARHNMIGSARNLRSDFIGLITWLISIPDARPYNGTQSIWSDATTETCCMDLKNTHRTLSPEWVFTSLQDHWDLRMRVWSRERNSGSVLSIFYSLFEYYSNKRLKNSAASEWFKVIFVNTNKGVLFDYSIIHMLKHIRA